MKGLILFITLVICNYIQAQDTVSADSAKKFTYSVLPTLSKNGVQYFCIETGPNSANKLTKLATENENLTKSLEVFINNNYSKTGEIPIPFFARIEDAEFLKTSADNRFKLFGVDQEFYASTLFLFDELLKLNRESVDATNYYAQACEFIH